MNAVNKFLGPVALLVAVAAIVLVFLRAPAPQPQPIPPGPQPSPVPPTPPEPVESVTGVVVVEDTAAAGQTRGMFLASKKVSAFFKNSNLEHAILSTATVGPDGKVPAAVKPFLDAAAGKTLPYLFQVAKSGKVIKQGELPLDPDKFVALFDTHTEPRALGMRVEKPKLAWKVYGEVPGTKLIPRDQWQEVSLESYLPPVHDQDGKGQCNASATGTAIETSREIGGMSYVELSAGDLYSQINGGRDQGSLLEDGLEVATRDGMAPSKLVPYVWNGRQYQTQAVKDARKQYRVVEAYLCPTFDHVASAIQQGFPVVVGIWWYDSYFRVDADGWLPRPSGNRGGHAITSYGLTKRGTQWGVSTRNSWGVAWGNGGNFVIPETAFDPNGISGYWAVRSVVRTPEPFPASTTMQRVRATMTPAEVFGLAP